MTIWRNLGKIQLKYEESFPAALHARTAAAHVGRGFTVVSPACLDAPGYHPRGQSAASAAPLSAISSAAAPEGWAPACSPENLLSS